MRRTLTFPMEVKALNDRQFEGYGSTFGNKDLGGDIVMPGAFGKSLKNRMPKMLYQHDPHRVPGVWEHVEEDSKGLFVRGRLIETTLGNDAYIELKEGALDGMSIGFSTVKDDGRRNPRKLMELELWEVSIVTFPMNESALVENIKQFFGSVPTSKRELEECLRNAGMSKSEAQTMISSLQKIFVGSDEMSGHDPLSDSEQLNEADSVMNSLHKLLDTVGVEALRL